jgi:hypothetical protein
MKSTTLSPPFAFWQKRRQRELNAYSVQAHRHISRTRRLAKQPTRKVVRRCKLGQKMVGNGHHSDVDVARQHRHQQALARALANPLLRTETTTQSHRNDSFVQPNQCLLACLSPSKIHQVLTAKKTNISTRCLVG